MDRVRMACIPTEQQESIALAAWLRKHEEAGRLTFWHTPNEGRRTGREGRLAKQMGLRPGFPDFMVLASIRGPHGSPEPELLAVELKRRDAPPGEPWGVRESSSHLRPNQVEWFERLASFGVECRACAGAGEAVEWLSGRLGLTAGRMHNADMENESTNPATTDVPGRINVIAALERGCTSMEGIRNFVPGTSAAIRSILKELEADGIVTRTGKARGTRYSLASKSEAAE